MTVDEYVRHVVAQAPPLTPTQAAIIRAAFATNSRATPRPRPRIVRAA